MVRHLHISKLEQIQASSDVWAGSLITRDAIFFNDICLRHHGELRAYKLRENHLPTYLEGGDYEVIQDGKCIDYLELAQANDKAWTIHELFPEHFWGLDFVEVPIAHDTWQPKIDELQAQIDDLDSTYATDAQVVASFAEQIAAAGDVFNLVDTKVGEEKTRAEDAELVLTTAIASEASTSRTNESAIEAFFEGTNAQFQTAIDQINDKVYVYVDSKRTDSYVESGTLAKPYKGLTAAFVKLADAQTDTVVFKLATGEYTGVHNVVKTSKNQSFALVGSGEATYLQGASSFAAVTDHDLLKLTRFKDVRLENLTVRYSGKYALYPEDCRKITVRNVHFENCAASDHGPLYEYTTSQADRISLWDAKVEIKNGGVCRIKDCEDVIIDNCSATKCMRGFRLQDCARGKITNNVCDRIVDNAYYLASGNYNGTAGCNNFFVANNKSSKCFHNSYLVIGGSSNVVQGNVADGGSGAGVQLFATVDCIVKNNSIIDCCKQAYNGYGGQSDAAASISSATASGGDQITGGSYLAVVSSNSVYQAGVGTGTVSTAIYIANDAYPAAANKVYLTGNYSDAAVHQLVDHLTVPTVTTTVVPKTVIVTTPGSAASPNQITADTADVVYLNTAAGHFELPQTGTSAVSLSIAVRNLKESSRVYAHDSAGADQLYKNDSNTAVVYDSIDDQKVEVFHYDHNTQQWRYVD